MPLSATLPPSPPLLTTPMPIGALAVVVALLLSGCGSFGRNENAEGVKLYQQGNYLGAVNHFQQALARQPGSPDCFYNLGATYHQQAKVFGRSGEWQAAEQYYHLCLARNPNHEACQRALSVLLVEEKRSPEAVALLEDWSRRQPGNPNPQIELARLCQEHGDLHDAENHLIDALAIDPANPRALVALGQVREASGDNAQALADYAQALAIDGRQPVVAARVASLGATVSGGMAGGGVGAPDTIHTASLSSVAPPASGSSGAPATMTAGPTGQPWPAPSPPPSVASGAVSPVR